MDDSRITAFCIDFNWDLLKRFASPGLYGGARAEEHLHWYRELGVNTIQSFCVSHNGYAWYKSRLAPQTPGMNEQGFLERLTELGHASDMRVMGYFSPGANGAWQRSSPDYSHVDIWNRWHVPFSTRYLDYLCRLVEEAVRNVPIDGFMVDWLWNVEPVWLDCEVEMYDQLMDDRFPGRDHVTAEMVEEFNRRATERAWTRIRETAKSVRDDCILWLSCNDLRDPQVRNTRVPLETDWLMNEHPDPSMLAFAREVKGPHTKLIQCMAGWQSNPRGDHNAQALLQRSDLDDVGIYGFAIPDVATTLPPEDQGGNARNIEAMKAFLRK